MAELRFSWENVVPLAAMAVAPQLSEDTLKSLKMLAWSIALAGVSVASLTGCDEESACTDCGGGGTGASTSDGGSGNTGGFGGGTGSGGTGTGGTGNTGTWTPLITANWALQAGSEKTSDIHTIQLDRDIYVAGIRPIAPQGTHHTVLGIDNLISGGAIYASGVGTNALMFPEGVGLKLPAGHTLILQLHLFNPTLNDMSGVSGIEVVEVDPAEVVQEAEIFLPGPMGLNIPANAQTTESGTCTVDSQQTIFAVFPHMHQLGTHFKTTVNTGGQDIVIHDGSYEFEHQAFIPFDPIQLSPGDTITTTCTWNNTTTNNVGWGESSDAEMCFSIMYRYPASSSSEFCTN